MKVVLAEKPSVARDIAAVVGATAKRDGYFEGNDYAVTYAFGHLVTIAEPEEMNSAWGGPWRIQQLPMIPNEWKYQVAEKARAQFNVIKRLFSDPQTSSIICATDAGREGEHIFRLIYKLAGSRRPVERLWISSLTAEAIKEGFNKLKPSADFDNLAQAAAGRAHADWIVGLNFTRAYTSINRQLCTIGRVQTPTLALIVDRQAAIEAFKSKNFFEILATFEPGFIARYITPQALSQAGLQGADREQSQSLLQDDTQPIAKDGLPEKSPAQPQTRLHDKAKALSILNAIAAINAGSVASVITTEKKTKAPALYDLLTVQKDANKRFGYTAQETLDLAQKLYEEHKLISYPRTESRHLSNDMVNELPGILSAVLKTAAVSKQVREAFTKEGITPGAITGKLLRTRLDKSYVDDAKLTDHHAIIPTNKTAGGNLSEKERNIYELVVARFLGIFLPAEIRDETTVIINLGEHQFRAKGIVIKQVGWTIVEPKSAKKEKPDSDETQQLPALKQAQSVTKRKAELKEGKTSPPKPYDDAALLTAMKNAGQEIDDEDLASYMKQRGLGTPATRAAIIEKLLRTSYIERNKKALIPTQKGISLINSVHSDLKDAKLTATWEQRLADMQDGKLPLNTFESEIADFVRRLLPEVSKQSGVVPAGGTTGGLGLCPQCKQGMVRETPKGAGCSRWKEGCKFSIWREVYGKKLSVSQMQELVKNGRTKEIKGFKKKDGTGTFAGVLMLSDEFKVRLDLGLEQNAATNITFGTCPQCQTGTIRTTPNGAGCSGWKEGCKFSIWRQQYGKELSDTEITELVEKRQTNLIKGFKKKDGSGTYDARLMVTPDFKIRLKFDNTDVLPTLI